MLSYWPISQTAVRGDHEAGFSLLDVFNKYSHDSESKRTVSHESHRRSVTAGAPQLETVSSGHVYLHRLWHGLKRSRGCQIRKPIYKKRTPTKTKMGIWRKATVALSSL